MKSPPPQALALLSLCPRQGRSMSRCLIAANRKPKIEFSTWHPQNEPRTLLNDPSRAPPPALWPLSCYENRAGPAISQRRPNVRLYGDEFVRKKRTVGRS